MPRMTRRKARQTRRAKRATRRSGGRKTVNVNRALTPFAQCYITRMKYSGNYVISTMTGQLMNLNSVFDPDRTGTGHQPYGFDSLSPIYNRYRVIACSYVVHAYSGTTPIRFGVLPANEIPPITNMDELCENPRSKWAIQIPAGSTQKVYGKVYIPSLVGRSKAQYMADDRYQSTVTGNPSELALLAIYAQSLANVDTSVNVTVTLNYLVEWFDANALEQS